MRMHTEEVPVEAKPAENGEPVGAGAEEEERPVAKQEITMYQKYRGLKNKLKYLIYEHRSFESELSRAQNKLVEITRDKTVLLDELLQYESVSGDEEATDDSGDERTYKPVPLKQRVGGGSQSPQPSKASQLTKQGIARATAIINSVSNNVTTTKVTKTGTKRQARQVAKGASGGPGAAVKISKVVSRVRQNDTPNLGHTVPEVAPNSADSASLSTSDKKLVVSYPINSIAADTNSLSSVSTVTMTTPSHTFATPSITSHHSSKTMTTTLTTTTKAVKRPIPALTKAQAPPPSSSASSSSSSALLVSSLGSVHVTTIAAPSKVPPPLISVVPGTKGQGSERRSSSSSSTTSSSSSNSDTGGGESGSDLSSGSEDEAMETENDPSHHNDRKGGGGGEGGGPVQIVSSVKSSSNLPRPKAILSPVKMTPTLLVRTVGSGGVPTSAHAGPGVSVAVVSSQPAFAGWTQVQPVTGEIRSPVPGGSEGAAGGVVGFLPIASPLSSPSTTSSALPFSSSALGKPGTGGSGSAFQVFSPKHHATTPPHCSASSLSLTSPPSVHFPNNKPSNAKNSATDV